MPDWPHYYFVRSRVDEILYIKLVKHILQFGYLGDFYKKKITYLEEDGFIYCTMGNPVEDTTIINRAPKENSYEERLKKGIFPKEESSNY